MLLERDTKLSIVEPHLTSGSRPLMEVTASVLSGLVLLSTLVSDYPPSLPARNILRGDT